MSNEVLVKVDNVSKRFCRSLKRSLWYGLQDLGSEIGGRRHGGGSGLPQSSADVQLRPDEFWAVKDVSFELRRGECLGLIGRNGAGKTTLLRMLNGLIKPDTGRIEIDGDIGAIIALGAGFNPLLTGRENIEINTCILGQKGGKSKESLEEVIEFSGIREFIDAPFQSYSSGMQVRLGFAVTTIMQPDVMLIDEVLAVGDNDFKLKCIDRINQISPKTAIIFVSHSVPQISAVCNRGLLLRNGCQEQGLSSVGAALKKYHNQSSIEQQADTIITTKLEIKQIDAKISFDATLGCIQSIINITTNTKLENCSILTTVITSDGVHLAQNIADVPAIEEETLTTIEININAAPLIHNKYTFYQLLLAKDNTQLARLTRFPSIVINSHLLETRTYAPVALESSVKLSSEK